jgi:hypothetical protein
VSASVGGAKKGTGAWTGVVAEDSGDMRECARWSTAGAGRGLRRGLTAWAERERERDCVK